MKSTLPQIRKLNARGFSHHFILPILAILAVVGIGVWTLHVIRAANTTYYSATCATKGTYKSGAKGGACISGVQSLLDGLQHAGWKQSGASFQTAKSAVTGQTFKYGTQYYLAINGTYNGATQAAVGKFINSKTVSTLNAGTASDEDWQMFCTDMAKTHIQLSSNKNSAALNFKNGNTSGGQSMVTIFNNICGSVKTITTSSGGGTGSTGSGSGTGSTGSGGTGSTGSGSGGSTTSGAPYASALSAYKVLSQSYTASQMISGNWAADANATQEGGGSCPTANTTYDSANSAVKLSTKGTAENAGSNSDCGHIRSAGLVSTNGTVVESKIWLPGSGSTLIDWASYWTDGTNWPTTGELDAIETQYGQSYVTYHYGSNNSSTGTASWESNKLASTAANDAKPGWNTVDMEFEANYAAANVYINGKLYTTVPGSVLAHNSQYINWGIGGPNLSDPNHASWPSGAGYEEVQYLKVFTK